MQDLQEIYSRIQETKAKVKELRAEYKDALAGLPEYQSVKEKSDGYRLRKKQLEAEVKKGLAGSFDALERLKASLSADQQMLSDISMSKLMKGETVELTGENDSRFEPVFSVKFRRVR